MFKHKMQKITLLTLGVFLGASGSLYHLAYAEKASNPSSIPYADIRAFTEIFERVKQDYVEPVDDKKLIKGAINGMITSLDPHSSYLDEDGFKELRESTQGEFGGLGMEVDLEDGVVRVTTPIEDTPAFRAGVKSGDYIIKIDDSSVRGVSLMDAVKKMRGKPGTNVTLTIARKGTDKPIVLTLTRAIIQVKSVKAKILEADYGYVRITQFQEHSVKDLSDALQRLYKENKTPLKGLVLDLRNDPGGVLSGAVGVSAAFLPKDALVVYTEGRTRDAKMRLTATREDYMRSASGDDLSTLPAAVKDLPVVVLINSGSASASEIVAGALQDHGRALVVGQRSFGKGSVQTILPLTNNTALKITTARYFTPNGRSIQAKGIEPDVVVEEALLNVTENKDAFRTYEADLDGHLSNPTGADKPASAASAVINSEQPKALDKADAPRDIVSANDYQLKQALSALKVQQFLLRKTKK